jgi:hypothetical protein
MKKRFTEEPVLLMPDQSKLFQNESDTSKVATGAVLIQLDSNGNQHPVAFLSKTFSETERKYKIYDQESLGIIRALKEWRHYIQKSGHTTIVYSDHKNLTYFRTAQKLNDRQARWSLYLSGFDLNLFTYQEQKWFNLTHSPHNQIMEWTNEWKKKTRLYCQTTSLSTCWTQSCKNEY